MKQTYQKAKAANCEISYRKWSKSKYKVRVKYQSWWENNSIYRTRWISFEEWTKCWSNGKAV